MNKVRLEKILFKVAFCAMACDGFIDHREIEELESMKKNPSFFKTIDLSQELKNLIFDFEKKGTKVIEELFADLKETELNTIQELIVLEIALRIINADNIHDENELKFIHLLRSKLKLHDETINDRFGKLDILNTDEYSRRIIVGKSEKEFARNVKFPEISELIKVSKKIENKK